MAGMEQVEIDVLRPAIERLVAEHRRSGKRMPLLIAAMMQYQFATAGRIKEVMMARRRDIVDEEGQPRRYVIAHILKQRKKSQMLREVKPEAMESLYMWLDVQQRELAAGYDDAAFSVRFDRDPVCYNTVLRWYKKTFVMMGDTGRHGTHGIRKSAAQAIYSLARKLLDDDIQALRVVQKYLHHSTMDVTVRYLGLGTIPSETVAGHLGGLLSAASPREDVKM